MRACRKRGQISNRAIRSWAIVLLLLTIDGAWGQEVPSIGQRPAGGSTAAAPLRLPGTDEGAGVLTATGGGEKPIRNELRRPYESSPELRVTSGDEPASAEVREPNQASVTATTRLSPQTEASDGNRQALYQSETDDSSNGSPVHLATSRGNINRTASVAPPQPLHSASVPGNALPNPQGVADAGKPSAPSVHVIGSGPDDDNEQGLLEPDSDLPSTPEKTLRLAPPKEKQSANNPSFAASWAKPQVMTTVLSLAVVLASFFALTWFVRRSKPTSSAKLPEEAVEILGRLPLEGRQQIQLVRFGRKLLLWVVTPNSVQTLSEITDPEDVDQLMEFCEASKRGSLSDSFRQVLNELGNEPTNPGFLADRSLEEILAASDSRPGRGRGRGRRGAYEA